VFPAKKFQWPRRRKRVPAGDKERREGRGAGKDQAPRPQFAVAGFSSSLSGARCASQVLSFFSMLAGILGNKVEAAVGNLWPMRRRSPQDAEGERK
jgi:hypothetical protein